MSTRIPLAITVLGILLGAIAASADEPRALGLRLQDFDGRWTQRDAGRDDVARRAAIDTAIQPLAWVVRKMAGGVLHATTAPESTVHFIWDGARLHQRLEARRGAITRPVEPGAPPTTSTDGRGEPFEGQWIWTPDGLQFSWRQHQAFGANLYRVDPVRHELTIDHSIHVTALEGVQPIRFQSRFIQAGLPAVSAGAAPGAR
ncbi:MAG: hypothetical protein U0900_02315 [Myxococcota bacterium]